MSGYGDDHKDMEYSIFVCSWVPEDETLAVTERNYRHVLARARFAEYKLKKYEGTLVALADLLADVS